MYEDVASYYQVFQMIFGIVEQDIGRHISWRHLTDLKSRDGSYIQVVLVSRSWQYQLALKFHLRPEFLYHHVI